MPSYLGKDVYDWLKGLSIGLILFIFLYGIAVFPSLTPQEVVDIWASFITFTVTLMIISLTVGEGIRNRRLQTKLEYESRERDRLEDQLNFYSPYISEINAHPNRVKTNTLEQLIKINSLQTKYIIYGSKELIKLLDKRFSDGFTTEIDAGFIIEQFKKDFQEMKERYLELTKMLPVSEI
jgi:hypothetical protein